MSGCHVMGCCVRRAAVCIRRIGSAPWYINAKLPTTGELPRYP